MSDIDGRPTRLVASRTTGSLLALVCLGLLGGAVQPNEVLAMVVVVAGMWGLLLSGRR